MDENGFIKRHLRRVYIGNAQTSQGFAFPKILQPHEKAAQKEKEGKVYTDDAEVWGEFMGNVFGVPGSLLNRKITFPEDLEMLVKSENGGDKDRLSVSALAVISTNSRKAALFYLRAARFLLRAEKKDTPTAMYWHMQL
jgi:hypothetical protein